MLSVKFWELDLVFSLILIGLMNEARRWLFKPSNTCVRSRGKCEALLPSCHLITPYLQCTVYWETYHLSLPIFLISWPGDKDFKLTQPFLNWLEATSGGDVPQIPAQTRRSQEIFKPKETSWNPIPSLSLLSVNTQFLDSFWEMLFSFPSFYCLQLIPRFLFLYWGKYLLNFSNNRRDSEDYSKSSI